jgi:hypothetical protein
MKKIKTKKLPSELQIVIIVFVGGAIIIGLFFTFIYVFYIHDYCPSSDDNVPIPVGCLMRFPEKYSNLYVRVLGKYATDSENWTVHSKTGSYEVTIYGTIYGPSAYFGDDAPVHLPFTFVNGTNLSNLVKWKEYYWYGIFRFTGQVSMGHGLFAVKGMFLEVSKIEEVEV